MCAIQPWFHMFIFISYRSFTGKDPLDHSRFYTRFQFSSQRYLTLNLFYCQLIPLSKAIQFFSADFYRFYSDCLLCNLWLAVLPLIWFHLKWLIC